ncbi:MAG: hypothetical protein HQL89_10430 [Magnetococcales bacterium]|nr:hypothetical protein [Magnetococcales bacterium]
MLPQNKLNIEQHGSKSAVNDYSNLSRKIIDAIKYKFIHYNKEKLEHPSNTISTRKGKSVVVLVLHSWGWLQFGSKGYDKKIFLIDELQEESHKIVHKPFEQLRLWQRGEDVERIAINKALTHWWENNNEGLNISNINEFYIILGDIGDVISMPEDDDIVRRGNWIRMNYLIPRALSCRLADYLPRTCVCVRKKVIDDFINESAPDFKAEIISYKLSGLYFADNIILHHPKVIRQLQNGQVMILNLEGRRTRIFLLDQGKLDCLTFDVPIGFLDLGLLNNYDSESVSNLLPIEYDELLRLMNSYPVPALVLQRFFSHLLGSLRLILEKYVVQEGKKFPEKAKCFLSGGFSLISGSGYDNSDWKIVSELGLKVAKIFGFVPEHLYINDDEEYIISSFYKKGMKRIGGIYHSKLNLPQTSRDGEKEEIEKYYSDDDLYFPGNSPGPAHRMMTRALASTEPSNDVSLYVEEGSSGVSDSEKFSMSRRNKFLFGFLALLWIIAFVIFRNHYNAKYEAGNSAYINASIKNKTSIEKFDEYRNFYRLSLTSRLLRLSEGMDERIKLKRFMVTKLGKEKYKMTLEGIFFNELQGDGSSHTHSSGTGGERDLEYGRDRNSGVKGWSDHFKIYLGHLFKSTTFVTYTIDELKIVETDLNASDGYGFTVTILEKSNNKRIDLKTK